MHLLMNTIYYLSYECSFDNDNFGKYSFKMSLRKSAIPFVTEHSGAPWFDRAHLRMLTNGVEVPAWPLQSTGGRAYWH